MVPESSKIVRVPDRRHLSVRSGYGAPSLVKCIFVSPNDLETLQFDSVTILAMKLAKRTIDISVEKDARTHTAADTHIIPARALVSTMHGTVCVCVSRPYYDLFCHVRYEFYFMNCDYRVVLHSTPKQSDDDV